MISLTLVLVGLTATAIGIYFDSSKANIRQLLRIIQSQKKHALIMDAVVVYIAGVVGLLAARPYNIEVIRDISGGSVITAIFKPSYELFLIPAVALLVCYAAPLVFLAAKRTKDKGLIDSLHAVSISWIAIGVIFVVFNVIQTLGKIDLAGALYFLIAVLFSFTALGFNKASLLGGFIEYKAQNVIGTRAGFVPLLKKPEQIFRIRKRENLPVGV